MKIWFDLSNSPHINLFSQLMRELESRGHQVVVTCRPLANTIDLLRLHRIPHEVVGEHYGAGLLRKVMGYPVRVWQLFDWLRPQRIDLAVSQSSFHSPLVASMLGIPSIYMNDNEHALGNIPSFLFASRILVPEFISNENLRRQWASLKKVTRYPGVKEGIYLWSLQQEIDRRRSVRPVRSRPSVFLRPEPWTAQYYKGDINFLDDLVIGLARDVDLTILPRGKLQGEHYRTPKFSNVRIIDDAMELVDISSECDMFIGAGGTMTREMAVLGVPTISVYKDDLLDVDRFLLRQGSFVHDPELTSDKAMGVLQGAMQRGADRILLAKGRESYLMLLSAIEGQANA